MNKAESVKNQALRILGHTNGHSSAMQGDITFGDPKSEVADPIFKAKAFANRPYDPAESFPEVELGLGVTAQLAWLTPDLARSFLASRGTLVQRAIIKEHLASLRRVLSEIGFSFNGQTIVFDWAGRMIDGQHRCEAVISSGHPFMTLVIRGIDPSAFDSIDQGAKKDASCTLKAKGYKNYATVASAAHILLRYKVSQNFPSINGSAPMIVNFAESHPELAESATIGKACMEVFTSSGIASAMHYLFKKVDKKLADEMFQKLITGADLPAKHPVLSLRNTLTKAKTEKNKSQHFYFAVTIKAWALLRQGKPAPKHFTYEFRKESFPSII